MPWSYPAEFRREVASCSEGTRRLRLGCSGGVRTVAGCSLPGHGDNRFCLWPRVVGRGRRARRNTASPVRRGGSMSRGEELKMLGRSLAAEISLGRPLVVLDLESTGPNPHSDRIVEIAFCRIETTGQAKHASCRVNPGVPIPTEATEVHHITDEDVAGKRTFEEIAPALNTFLVNCDLAGYGIARFDIPLLRAEFRRAGIEFSTEGRSTLDALDIFFHYQPRDLKAAVLHYTGQEIEDAHSAEGDVLSAMLVLNGQLREHDDLPRHVDGIQNHVSKTDPDRYDEEGKLVWRGNELRLAFGKHRGEPLAELVANEADYIDWILGADFSQEVKNAVRQTRHGSPPLRTD